MSDPTDQMELEKAGILNTSAGRCDAAVTIEGAAYRCELAEHHKGWAHSSKAAQTLWADASTTTPEHRIIMDLVASAWDDGNAKGLDGYTGPERGSDEIDPEAVTARSRQLRKAQEKLNALPQRDPQETISKEKLEQSAKSLAKSLLLQGQPLAQWERLTPYYQNAILNMVSQVFTAAGLKVEGATQ
ncbi:hypothetical protein M3B43_11880 [Nesterenkonia massiliensis]|uniref:Uncharacterized protein n=1 Tax=Nesterenkonia massiliensis TaxID=1232429 RepID=A0ABT2HU12_9MICC|nr:hypothetical protein [Nesterenkonia massiliensis]MCT1608000.1 hypothetical protein [Nesterenkonia massiliensis]